MPIEVIVPGVPTVGVAIPGIQGPPGAGTSITTTATAEVPIAANQVVSAGASGVHVTDITSAADIAGIVGVAQTSALAGGSVTILCSGVITESTGWDWAPGFLFCSSAGGLTQTAPTTGAVVRIGVAASPTSVYIFAPLIIN